MIRSFYRVRARAKDGRDRRQPPNEQMGRGDEEVVGGGGEGDREALVAGLQRWCLDVSEWDSLSTEQWDFLSTLLPEAEGARVKKFMRENDRRLALGSRLLQRAVVSKVFGLEFSEVEIRRTPEKKPYFAGLARASLPDSSRPPHLKNWNFNVSHHGKYVAIASEPICLCGVDIVDTNRRSNEAGPAEDYLRYFTEHFTEKEWDAIRRTDDDEGMLRRFYLNWGLKEAYVKAVGQGLGYDLRRVSFVAGDWLNFCSKEDSGDQGSRRRPRCSCPRGPAAAAVASSSKSSAVSDVSCCGGSEACDAGELEEGGRWGDEDHLGCLCGSGIAIVEVDGIMRPDWSFQVFDLPDGYAACVARGPPSACSPSGLAAGVISDPDVDGEALAQGQSLPQLRFRAVRLEDVVPPGIAAKLEELRAT